MKIHGVVDNDIHPPRFGSTQRSFGLFRGLARRHDVDVLCVVPYRNAAPREETADGVRMHRRRAWYTAAAWRLERLGIAPLVLAAGGHSARGRRWLDVLPGEPDALLLGPWFGGLLRHSRATLGVYLSQNVESDHFRATAPRVLARDRWTQRVHAMESRLATAADRVVVCSSEDGERMRALYGVASERLLLAPNGWDETCIRPPSAEERARARAALAIPDDAHAGVFLGSAAPTNRAAVRLLIERIMPEAARHGAVLIVAGDAGRDLTGMREPWLRVVPAADDVLPVLHAADAGLNPVVSGGGSNVKVPTCLAAGLSVLTTPFGLRGYPDLAAHVVTAEQKGFAAAWAGHPRGWHARGEAMPAALEALAWGAIGERLGGALEAALGGHAATAGADAHGPAGEGRRALA